MIITIDTSTPNKLDWGSKGAQRIAQNVFNLIRTWKYEVAYNRVMGMDPSLLDKPLKASVAEYTSQVYQVVSRYEPRATVKEVKFLGANDEGVMDFRVVIEV